MTFYGFRVKLYIQASIACLNHSKVEASR